ncbi:MAG: ankyrin repeat domain-containing protein [Pseudomonadota bacterium]|nr:ankyrin repeat domain-containing protein [Pseudomonadota bacterium]
MKQMLEPNTKDKKTDTKRSATNRTISYLEVFSRTVLLLVAMVLTPHTSLASSSAFVSVAAQTTAFESVYRAAATLDAAALLNLKSVINSKDARGWTALHRAAYEGIYPSVEILLEHGAQADIVDDAGKTPQDYAIFGKHLRITELFPPTPAPLSNIENKLIKAVEDQDQRAIADLIAEGDNPLIIDDRGRTLMHIAVANNSLAAVLALLGAVDLFHPDKDGKLAYDIAVERAADDRSYALIASHLLEAMAGVKVKDPKGWPTLNWAVVSGDIQRVNCLLDRGAKIGNGCQNALEIAILMSKDVRKDKIFQRLLAVEGIDAASRRGDTGLMSASRRGDLRAVDIFLEHGANVDVADLWHGFTILRIASEEGHLDIVNRLLAAGADPLAVDKLGETALHRASARGHLDIVKALIPVSDVHAQNIGGMTPLHWAARGGHIDVMIALLEAGAIPNGMYGRDIDHEEADASKLFEALAAKDIEAVKYALDHHAIPNAINDDRTWALAVAVISGFKEAVELLLAYGAAPDLTSSSGITSLQHAVLLQRKDEAKALLRYGADPNFPPQAKKFPLPSPLVLAAKKGFLELAEIVLLEVGGVNEETMQEALEVAKEEGNDDIVESITRALEAVQ